MDNTNLGFVNLNDQYRMNTSKSRRIGNNLQNAGNSVSRSGTGKQRSSSHGSSEK